MTPNVVRHPTTQKISRTPFDISRDTSQYVPCRNLAIQIPSSVVDEGMTISTGSSPHLEAIINIKHSNGVAECSVWAGQPDHAVKTAYNM
jgi:hypothetical protein